MLNKKTIILSSVIFAILLLIYPVLSLTTSIVLSGTEEFTCPNCNQQFKFKYTIEAIHDEPPSNTQKKVVLFDWDGVQRDVFYELLNAGKLPYIESLTNIIDQRCVTHDAPLDVITLTRPQTATMISGYSPLTHGLYWNDYRLNPSGVEIPLELSMFYRVEQHFDNLGIDFRIAGGGGKPWNVGDMLFGWIPEGAPKWDHTIGYFSGRGFDTFYSYHKDIVTTQPISMTEKFLDIAQNVDNYLYFFQFRDPDDTGHKYGVHSQQYRQAIINCDKATREIMQKLAPTNPALIVTSDHGFGYPNNYSHRGAPNTFLAANFPLNTESCMMSDVAVTIYDLLGIDYSVYYPPLEGRSLID